MKNYSRVFTERQEKYLHYHQVKLINMNILQKKIYYFPIKVKITKQVKFTILFQEKHYKSQQNQLDMQLKSKQK